MQQANSLLCWGLTMKEPDDGQWSPSSRTGDCGAQSDEEPDEHSPANSRAIRGVVTRRSSTVLRDCLQSRHPRAAAAARPIEGSLKRGDRSLAGIPDTRGSLQGIRQQGSRSQCNILRDPGIILYRDPGIIVYWIPGSWSTGIPGSWSTWDPGIMEYRDPGIIVYWIPGS